MKKIPKLFQMVGIILLIYFSFIVLFDYLLNQVIPTSLLRMYMFFIIAGVVAVFTFTEGSTEELLAPIMEMMENPAHRKVRNAVLTVMPILAGAYLYSQMVPSVAAPVELRSIHPAPPSSAKLFGQRYDLQTLENPLRKYEKDDPEKFSELVKEGARVYIENCHICHGDKLDGQGLYAVRLNPTPLSFRDVGTIAQLQESYLFWRISTGGPGLPDEAAPWISSMPVWQEFLNEEEIWQVILFLYDYTGHRPRTWEE